MHIFGSHHYKLSALDTLLDVLDRRSSYTENFLLHFLKKKKKNQHSEARTAMLFPVLVGYL